MGQWPTSGDRQALGLGVASELWFHFVAVSPLRLPQRVGCRGDRCPPPPPSFPQLLPAQAACRNPDFPGYPDRCWLMVPTDPASGARGAFAHDPGGRNTWPL